MDPTIWRGCSKHVSLLLVLFFLSLFASLHSVRTESVVVGPGLNVSIPDGKYDGTLNSMRCVPLRFTGGGFVEDAELTIGLDHPWVGDLIIKLLSPTGTLITSMNRPGVPGSVDGASPPGETGNHGQLSHLYPIYFQDSAPYDPETMGETLQTNQIACKDDGRCKYFPNHGASVGGDFAEWNGEDATGTWKLCVGDARAGNAGVLDYAVLLLDFPLAPVIDLTVDNVNAVPAKIPTITMNQRPSQNITFRVSNLEGDAKSILCTFDRPPEFSVTNITHVGKGFSPAGGFQPGEFEAECTTTGLHYDCKYTSVLGGRGQLFETTFVGTVALIEVGSEDETVGDNVELTYEVDCVPVMMFDKNQDNNVGKATVLVEVRGAHVGVIPSSSKDNNADIWGFGVGMAVASILCLLATLAAVVLAVILGLRYRHSHSVEVLGSPA